ncbi:helix-turn-helix transcriptional regulator [Martelella radicis]|uniref:DNA-binding CsgD family transcriptional regulator n=1 Tax=Martelella radicis TaxID=1397476 RepID=A0A7W6KIT8_9HYPH|nr:helix-turn-helix transcriptional regulator [Martelella radicis]MBB4121948.1 DNA-binding CsgD family transcriptional regulator [Martelella radicis]
MTNRPETRKQGRSQTIALAAFMLMQAVAAVFFVADATRDLFEKPPGAHSIIEALIAVTLVAGIFLAGWQLRLTLERMYAQERALDTARGDFIRIIDAQFDDWGLTPAEREVGLLALKGLDISEIARLRGAAQGTVRAQLTRIYAKAGVSGRAQFAAWFVEDLLGDGISRPDDAA